MRVYIILNMKAQEDYMVESVWSSYESAIAATIEHARLSNAHPDDYKVLCRKVDFLRD